MDLIIVLIIDIGIGILYHVIVLMHVTIYT